VVAGSHESSWLTHQGYEIALSVATPRQLVAGTGPGPVGTAGRPTARLARLPRPADVAGALARVTAGRSRRPAPGPRTRRSR
jgi:hypothetical protein